MSTDYRILLIEDNKGDARLIHEMLKGTSTVTSSLSTVSTLKEGLKAAVTGNFDVILLDLSLPESGGLETFNRVKDTIDDIPIIVLTGNTDESMGIEAVGRGAQDYIIKGQVDTPLLVHSIRYAIERNQLKAETERQAREAMKSECRFRSMIEHNADAVVIIDRAGNIRFINPAGLALFGRKSQLLIGKKFGFPINADEPTEIEIPSNNNLPQTVEMRVVETEWEGEKAYLASLRDVTQRKRFEEEIKNLAKFPSEDPNPVLRISKDGTILYSNESGKEIMKSGNNKNLKKIPPYLYDTVKEAHESGRMNIMEISADNKTYSLTFMPIKDTDYVNLYGQDISNRKITEKELESERNLLRTLIDNIPDFIWIKDKESRFILANMAVANILGLESPDRLIGKSDYDFYPSDAADEYRRDEQHVLTNMTAIFNKEQEKTHPDGMKAWILTTKLPYRNSEGDIIGVVGTGRDITERRLAEEALERSEAFKDRIIESSPDSIKVLDLDGTLRYMSKGGQHLMEIEDIDSLIGTSWIDFWKGQDRLKAKEAVSKARSGGIGSFEGFRETTTGTPKWWEVVISPITDTKGEVEQLIAISRDITERKLADEELRKLSIAVQQSPVSILITDVQGDIEYVNRRFSEITGYNYKEVLGKNPRLLKSGEHTPEFYDSLWGTISAGREWQGEICNKKKNGELFWESATISPIKNEEGMITHYIGIKENITDRRNLEDQLRQSQKMEAIGRFAGGIAHDFNNMMTAVIGFSDYLLSSRQDDDALVSIIKQIKAAGQRAASLTQQLLAFSRRQAIETQLIDLQLVITTMEQMLRQLIGEDIILSIALDKKPSIIKTDRSQVEQIIMNLVVNARDAMPQGGKLIIETETAVLDDDYCKDWIDIEAGTYVALSITDTGSGMDKETLSHIYEPFYTTKEIGKGTGLGLSTVYGIVKQSQGHVHCYSEPQKGTTFKIYFPAITQQAENTQFRDEDSGEVKISRGTETILLVEDEEVVRKIASSVLRSNGYHVFEATNSDEALAICKDRDISIDLLVTDVIMPGMQGPDLARQILDVSPETSVLFISGYPDNVIEKLELFEVDNNFLQKPFTPKKLLLRVQELLNRGL
ncbi:MAG: PAS domain S-box protein [Spirochaetes bacterium]|nr:PAS domain S-box protein [Spirochaetota bacterium]